MRLVAALSAALSLAIAHPHHHHPHQHHHDPCKTATPYVCAWRLAYQWYGWRGAEWRALDGLVSRESGWDPCAHWPGVHHDCSYNGAVICAGVCSNACGIPQATPCPVGWRGHLDQWRRQVHWLLWYIRSRWGDPITAAWHERTSTY